MRISGNSFLRAAFCAKLACAAFLLSLALLSCAGRPQTHVILPRGPVEDSFGNWVEPLCAWEIVETRDGPGDSGLPDWARYFYAGQLRELEADGRFGDRYAFVGISRGAGLDALGQWADGFCPRQDFIPLLVRRVEMRFVREAALYPDDKYGDFFMRAIRAVSDGDFHGAVREDSFWVKRREISGGAEEPDFWEAPRVTERFEYLVLVSVDRGELQSQLGQALDGVRTARPLTREQAAAIADIRRDFFEGF